MDYIKSKDKMKKKAELSDESSSDDSDTSLHDIRCNICDLNFSNAKTYNDHVKGKRHKKNADLAKLMSKCTLSNKKGESESDDEDDDSNEMYCEVCDKSMSGYIPYMTHLKGSFHAKHVKKQKLKEGMVGMPEVLDKENEDHNNENDDDVLQNLFAHCSTCKKAFSGPESFHMHLKSATHKKKVQQSKALEDWKAKHPDETNKSDDEDSFTKCSVCNKSFSGLVPYKMHMQSNIHKKNLEKKKLVEEIKEFFSTADNAYICQECEKKFTDPKNFKYHLTNNSHEKLKVKRALSEFLTSNPEIVFLTQLKDNDSTEESDSDGSDEDYYLVCKLCHVSFSGPESAEDHVKSKKHIALRKQKKMLNILKRQKKERSDSSDANDKKEVSRDSGTQDKGKELAKNSRSPNGQTSQSRKFHLSTEDDFEVV